MSKVDLIRRAALRALTRRDYSQQELTQKLLAKGFPREDIRTVIDDLVEANLISDARFTESFIHWRRARGIGPVRISLELQTRGVHAEIIAERLQMADNAWFTEARNVWQKHFKGKLPTDFKSRAQQMRFMQYRGFTREQIQSVLEIDHSGDNHDHEEDSFKQQ